jgi:hypothetical protein
MLMRKQTVPYISYSKSRKGGEGMFWKTFVVTQMKGVTNMGELSP